ncbi:Phosphoglycerate dehydrogenase [Novosphingobium sp. CF614]|uniref:NAD(P)-dependent oxidoreductase n=1 Tax=Novosphingobium sp. CF614 TaxID=1884364 RepID=UPI0008E2FE05|nr:NAD(P)-dependent oxidoreductase [Novosphingobium sp. CF614]SFF77379.1 Phosphoglycerate dehydrogenase [Novosphingobium sp. CF614]
MDKPCVVIAKPAYDVWKPSFDAANLPVRYALIESPEVAILDGKEVAPADVPANAVWLTIEALRGPLRRTFKHLLETAPDLQWVQSLGAGTDIPLLQDVLKRGARLTTAHVSSISIAEFVMRTVLERFHRSDERRMSRAAKEYPRDDFREIYRTTWLIYGMGAIGSCIAERARAFGAHVIGVRRNPTGNEPVDEMIAPSQVLDTLGRADVVVFSMPSTPETQNIANADFFARMKPGSVFVNIARAALTDEAALLASLDSGHLDYAVLDVHSVEEAWLYRKERMDDSPLWTHPKIMLSPHGAGHGDGRHVRITELFIDNLRRFLAGENPLPDEAWL